MKKACLQLFFIRNQTDFGFYASNHAQATCEILSTTGFQCPTSSAPEGHAQLHIKFKALSSYPICHVTERGRERTKYQQWQVPIFITKAFHKTKNMIRESLERKSMHRQLRHVKWWVIWSCG